MRTVRVLAITLLMTACASAPTPPPPDQRWVELRAQWETIEAMRGAHPIPAGDRRSQIEALARRQKKIEPVYLPFIASLRAYAEETADPRALSLYARERMLMGDEYAEYLARYDRAIEIYRSALAIDPSNKAVLDRIASAEARAFIDQQRFYRVQPGMTEAEVVEVVGYPRVDWMRETVRNGRVYSVWIYPKEDGGAAAIYFDNGVCYHKNWTAAHASDTESSS